MMSLLFALLGCAADAVSTCRPVDGTYRIGDSTGNFYTDVAGGTAVIDGDLMIFEYTDADGMDWKVTYAIADSDCGADSAPK